MPVPPQDLRYRAVMRAAVDAIITITDKGTVLDFNPAAERIFGYQAEEVLGQNVSMLMPEPYRSNHDGYLERFVRLRETRVLNSIRAVHGRRKNGELFPIELSLAQCTELDGAIFVGILRDLTDLNWKEDAVRLYTERLRQSTQELESFTATATHDLREPLRKVQFFTDRLRTLVAEHGGEKERDSVNRILDAAVRMQALVDDIGSYSSVAFRQRPAEPTELDGVLRGALANLDGRIEEAGGALEIGPLPTLELEPVPMRHVFENLIANALKYRRPDAPLRVQITAARATTIPHGPDSALREAVPWWEIQVQDNGIGIAPEHHERIFEMFTRLHVRSEYPGTGVGLALCRKVITRHNGTIAVRSVPGQGSTFIITLPERQAD